MIVRVSPAFLPGRDHCTASVCPSMPLEVTGRTSPDDATVTRNRLGGRKKDSSEERGIYRNKSPLNFKNIENYVGRLSLLPIIPPSTVPRRALKAVAEQQIRLETMRLRHEQINSGRREQLQLQIPTAATPAPCCLDEGSVSSWHAICGGRKGKKMLRYQARNMHTITAWFAGFTKNAILFFHVMTTVILSLEEVSTLHS